MLPAPLLNLVDRAQGPLLRTALALPPALLRRAAGRPVVIDGQTLDPEQQLALRMMRLSGLPGAETVPIPQGRAILREQSMIVGSGQPIGSVRDLRVDGADGELPARLYVPRSLVTGAGPDPLLVFFHGGGWVFGDLDSHDALCRVLAEQAGVRVLSVAYRLAPEAAFPAAHDDCIAAYRWVLDNLDRLDADPDRLAVGGDSAGGCLAATTAIAAAEQGWPLAFQLLIYPGTDMTGGSASRALFGEGFYLTQQFMDLPRALYVADADETDPRVSPLHADLPPGLAPAYLCTAGFDPLRDEGEAYAAKLTDAGVQVEVQRFEGLIHGFANWVSVGRSCPAAVAVLADRLRAGLSG
ncbi:alpha/beta hydrolase [Nocardioides limicola]|uniref:alpha/beta hydrolase n=1 Tax=Nocardioides limicola TaxID=2803368 RepID=UPI00193C0023|nr:alpha/beta hydrolase [Nocardioides sp. DJM-14]